MGRYTSVQSYSDQDAKVASIAYTPVATSTEASGEDRSSGAGNDAMAVKQGDSGDQHVKLNRVDNVSGSSAGAGSGDFHMYRASRRRELDRVEMMEKTYAIKKEAEEFEAKRKRGIEEFQAQTQKRAEKRRRRKERAKSRNSTTTGDEEKNETTQSEIVKLSDEVSEIPNDGSFLEKMLKLQQEQAEEDPV